MRSAARGPFPSEVASLLPGNWQMPGPAPYRQATTRVANTKVTVDYATVSPRCHLPFRWAHDRIPGLRSGMAPMPSGSHQGVNRGRSRSTAATVGGSLEAWARQPRPAQLERRPITMPWIIALAFIAIVAPDLRKMGI